MTAAFGLGSTAEEIVGRLPDQARVDAFVDSLSDERAVAFTFECSKWRRNGVADALGEALTWTIRHVPVGELEIQQAEGNPQYVAIWQRHACRLGDVAGDPDLRQLAPYSRYHDNQEVAYPIVLARLHGPRYRVFDGVHRAIQLVWTGETELEVCAPVEAP